MMDKLGVAVVGAGWVAGEHLKAFAGNPHAEVVAVCGRNEARAKACAVGAGIRCDIMTDFDKMLAREDVDIVAVATPPDCHCTQAIAAVQAGKHLLLEKAMAVDIEESRLIRDAVAAAGVKSIVSFVLRWNPLFNIIKSQLADDAIGKVFFGEVDYYHGIGPWYKQYAWNVKKDIGASSLLSAGIHAVDALRWFMGGEVVEVCQYATHGGGVDFSDYEYPPTSCTMLKFADGRVDKVTSCIECIQPYVFNINLVGTHGSIRNNKFWSKTKFAGQNSWVEVPCVSPDSADVSHHPFVHEINHFVDCIRFDQPSLVDVADAFKTHEICFAADLSGKTGKPVSLPM